MSRYTMNKRSPAPVSAGRVVFLSLFGTEIIFFFILFFPIIASAAGDIRIFSELKYSSANADSTNNDTGEVTESDTSIFQQNYGIKLTRDLYPFVSVDGGATFELDEFRTTSDDEFFKRTSTEIRPFAGLSMRSPLYSAGIAYRFNEIEDEIPDLPTSKDFQKIYNTSFSYRPAGLPRLQIFHDRLHNYNDERTEDSVSEQSTATVTYDIRTHPVRYSYRRNKTEDRAGDFEQEQENHAANVAYRRDFLDNRLSMNTSYGVNFEIRHVPTDVSSMSTLSPAQGLFSTDNTPQDGPALSVVTALIDGGVTASTGINMGWSVAAEPDRNMGLDFGFDVSVDRIEIHVDRSVPSSASGTFVWSVYTSPDNTDTSVWTLHTVVASAPFGRFENRFDISFPAVTTRFIKVVAAPLSLTFSGVTEIENIFITEMKAFVTTTNTEDEKRVDSTQNITAQLNSNLSDKTSVGYNFLTTIKKEDRDPSSDLLAMQNGIFVRHIFNRIFSATANASRDESRRTLDKADVTRRVSHEFAALLSASYLPTLSQTLSFGTSEDKLAEGRSTESSLFLRTNAALYHGWDAYTDIGYSLSDSVTAGETESLSFSAQTQVTPNEEFSVDLRYAESRTRDKNQETNITDRTYDVQSFYTPFRYLSFFARVVITESSDGESNELQTYSVSWSPFPDGDLQIVLSHSETLRPSDDTESRSTGGAVRWDINRYANLVLSYYYSQAKALIDTTDSSTFRAELDMNF